MPVVNFMSALSEDLSSLVSVDFIAGENEEGPLDGRSSAVPAGVPTGVPTGAPPHPKDITSDSDKLQAPEARPPLHPDQKQEPQEPQVSDAAVTEGKRSHRRREAKRRAHHKAVTAAAAASAGMNIDSSGGAFPCIRL